MVELTKIFCFLLFHLLMDIDVVVKNLMMMMLKKRNCIVDFVDYVVADWKRTESDDNKNLREVGEEEVMTGCHCLAQSVFSLCSSNIGCDDGRKQLESTML